MNDNERLQLFKRLFPLIHLTIGEMLQAKVYRHGADFLIQWEHGTLAVDIASQKLVQWNALAKYAINDRLLDPEQTDIFWQRLYGMLADQPAVVNGLNQGLELIELKPFDKADWDCWNGAEMPPDSEPLINPEVKAQGFPNDQCLATIIMDATGIEIYLFTEDTMGEAECWYELPVDWPAGKAIIDQMNQPITPNMLRHHGFIKVS